MGPYRNILLFADPSMLRTPAYDRAVALAQATDSKLHIVTIGCNHLLEYASRSSLHDSTKAKEGWLQIQQQWLIAQSETLKPRGIEVSSNAVWTLSPREEMVEYANEFKPDLIVKDVRHEAFIRRPWLTPSDWHLLTHVEAPTLLVGKPTHVLPRRVVVAIDASPVTGDDEDFNDQIVQQALAFSIQCKADLYLVSSVDYQFLRADAQGMMDSWAPDLYENLHQDHAAALQSYAQAHHIPEDRVRALSGWTPHALANFVDSVSADVIVVGTHARRGVHRALMGSVAESIIDAAPCDVLVTKPVSA